MPITFDHKDADRELFITTSDFSIRYGYHVILNPKKGDNFVMKMLDGVRELHIEIKK